MAEPLFWAHPEVSPLAIGSAPLAVLCAVMLVALPLLGNLAPRLLSFLLAMRYYAGNGRVGCGSSAATATGSSRG